MGRHRLATCLALLLVVPAAACEEDGWWGADCNCKGSGPRGNIARFNVVQPVEGAQIRGTVTCEFDVATDKPDEANAVFVRYGIANEGALRQWTPDMGPIDCTPTGLAREVIYIFEAQSTITGDNQMSPPVRVNWQP